MREYWLGLHARERASLILGVVIVAGLLFYTLMWEPVTTQRARLRESVAEQQQLLQWMEAAAGEVRRRQGASGNNSSIGRSSLLSRVEGTVKKMNLSSRLKRMQPDGEGKVRVWLDDIPFDDVLLWIGVVLEGGNIAIDDLVVDKSEATGLVNARLLLQELTL